MELRDLEYFLSIAREENITAAAKVLHLSQPALTRQLKENSANSLSYAEAVSLHLPKRVCF